MVALPAETELDAYRIVGLLGEGGFGVTYLAEDRTLGRKFAIKEYFPQSWASRDEGDSASLNPNSASKGDYRWGLERFVEEARTLARFRHPAIVQVSRIIEANNTAYMVLDYEDGDDFGDWLEKLGRRPTQAELDAMLEPLLDALSLIHRNNILHRDIAPDNLYIRADGSPVLLDFGSAREAMGHRTQTVSAIIKSGYSPVEQYTTAGRDQGPWTDIYALGATLYKAVTGQAPPEATQRAIEDEYVPAAQAARGDYRPSFLAAIDHALQRHHKDRPQDIAAWKREFFASGTDAPAGENGAARRSGPTRPRKARASEPPSAPTPRDERPTGRKWKWAAAVLLAGLLGAGGYYMGVVRPAALQQQSDLAERQRQQRVAAQEAARRADEAAWATARRERTAAAFKAYIARHPRGRHVAEARREIAALEQRARTEQDGRQRREEAQRLFNQGVRFNADGNFDRAIQALDDAIRRYPNFAEAYRNRAISYYRKGQTDRALADFNAAIRIDPRSAEAYNGRGIVHARSGQTDQAIADFNKAIEIDPRLVKAYNNRGRLFYDGNQYARAITDLDKAIQINPDYHLAYANRGLAFEKIGLREKAIADFRRTIQLRPGHRIANEGLRRLGVDR